MSCEETFIRHLRDRGFRLTPQRELVLSVLHQMEGFASAEEIYERVHRLSAAVDISTVYRTLDLLQAFGLVACVEGADGQRRYDLVTDHGPHIHLVCTNCGAVVGVPPETLAAGLSRISEQYGFAVDMAQLHLPGLCARCRAGETAGHE
ncbi:MAG: Fur family transcriptional regulator [Anaerolineae bacterium]